jgi:hypothetical protein
VSPAVRTISLDDVRADGWFERLGEGSAAFAQLTGIVGSRFVAFAIVAGLRITALAVDARNPDSSSVEFGVGDGGPSQKMPLGEFRRRLAAALLGEDEGARPLPASPKSEDLQALIGFRYVLLSPIFGIKLLSLKVAPKAEPIVEVERAGGRASLTVASLRELVRQGIRDEAARAAAPKQPFAIDLEVVKTARLASEAGQPERVVALLGGWPGPLSMLLRTAEGQSLTKEVRTTIAEGLGILGSAYGALDRGDWAHEVLRLAIQWGADGPATADLFRRLGKAHLDTARPGEAIGLLRRGLALGGSAQAILPLLARAFAGRQRHIAAMLTIEQALEAGVDPAVLADVREEASGALGEPWTRFRAYLSE